MSDSVEHLIGKPLVVYIDGERREVGTITNAKLAGVGLFVAATLTEPIGEAGVSSIEGTIFDALHDNA